MWSRFQINLLLIVLIQVTISNKISCNVKSYVYNTAVFKKNVKCEVRLCSYAITKPDEVVRAKNIRQSEPYKIKCER